MVGTILMYLAPVNWTLNGANGKFYVYFTIVLKKKLILIKRFSSHPQFTPSLPQSSLLRSATRYAKQLKLDQISASPLWTIRPDTLTITASPDSLTMHLNSNLLKSHTKTTRGFSVLSALELRASDFLGLWALRTEPGPPLLIPFCHPLHSHFGFLWSPCPCQVLPAPGPSHLLSYNSSWVLLLQASGSVDPLLGEGGSLLLVSRLLPCEHSWYSSWICLLPALQWRVNSLKQGSCWSPVLQQCLAHRGRPVSVHGTATVCPAWSEVAYMNHSMQPWPPHVLLRLHSFYSWETEALRMKSHPQGHTAYSIKRSDPESLFSHAPLSHSRGKPRRLWVGHSRWRSLGREALHRAAEVTKVFPGVFRSPIRICIYENYVELGAENHLKGFENSPWSWCRAGNSAFSHRPAR